MGKEAAPKKEAVPTAAPAQLSAESEAAIKAIGDEIRTLKEKLKGEGLSGKKINEHPEIKILVDKLNVCKAQMAGSPAKAPTKATTSPANAPAPVSGGNVDDQIKAVGDEI